MLTRPSVTLKAYSGLSPRVDNGNPGFLKDWANYKALMLSKTACEWLAIISKRIIVSHAFNNRSIQYAGEHWLRTINENYEAIVRPVVSLSTTPTNWPPQGEHIALWPTESSQLVFACLSESFRVDRVKSASSAREVPKLKSRSWDTLNSQWTEYQHPVEGGLKTPCHAAMKPSRTFSRWLLSHSEGNLWK